MNLIVAHHQNRLAFGVFLLSEFIVIMSQKRPQEDGKVRPSEGNSPDQDKRRRVPALRNVVHEVMKMQSIQHWLEPVLEPLIRRVVREEVEVALRKHLNNMKRNGGKEVNSTESRSLQLQFLNNLSLPVFTGARIEAEECSAIKVAIVDALTGQIVTSGPESSAKVEVVVLEGDFDGDEGDNWTLEEFKNNIVREREGKKPLLTGDAFLTLTEGIGLVGEISFTDNSSWTRSRRFRLGARVVDGSNGTRVREAKTESFIVRDHRGELYKKHHPPSLSDEVWRLEKIGKDGAFHKRLSRENINTVKDFLTMLYVDPPRLRHILGTGMSAKMWEVTVEHARTCVLDKRMYLYCPPGSQQKSGVAFNIVGQVTGLLSECQYVTIDKLSETEKIEAQNLVISAFERWEEVFSFDDEASLIGESSNLANIPYTSSAKTEIPNGSKLLASQKMGGFDYAQPSASSPDIISTIYSVGGMSGLDDYALHGIENMGLRYDQTLSYPGQVTNSLICDTDITQTFCDEDHLRFFDSDLQTPGLGLESQADLQTAVDGFLLQRTVAVQAQRRWTKVFSVLKWFSIKRRVKEKFRGVRYSNGL
ncbi:PREDICTED: calmodulin-binding protein 60 A isoform X1 [Theobroma cacao]|uniref:Calmodulin-binding protein 60 A isoform X1 n=1 Tax=Theobroma cacao TaxID=3641 RepID=A0AB32W3A0_THECC|nr:PREDICTED: calmodulin-binding protein 60 A isoform X1 [Theobroma cacao]